MNRQKRQRAARLRAKRDVLRTARQMATVRFALRVHDLFRHGYTFTEAVFRAVGRTL